MKNLWMSMLVLFAVMPVAAASNCVSRVDKNLNKTTTEKVNYCLEEDQTPEVEQNKTEIVWSDTYSVQYPAPKNKKTAPQNNNQRTYKNTDYAPDQVPVSMEYIDRKDYPAFRNDILPALPAENAHATAMEALQPDKSTSSANKKTAKKQKPAVKVNKPTKPERKMTDQEIAAALQTDPVQGNEDPLAAPTAPQAAQVQKAQALQNDPLATNPTDNGTVPNEFLDDSVMGPADFGYNATDPAFQQ